jgi:hypothetical protein
MRTYAFDFVGVWESVTDKRTEFIFMLNWPDVAAKDAAWRNFRADEEWRETTRVAEAEHGRLVGEIEDRLLVPTPYAPKASVT